MTMIRGTASPSRIEPAIFQIQPIQQHATMWKAWYHEHCTYLPAMAGWFIFSALLSAYNKTVFGNGHLAFPCPLLLTSIHFGTQWFVSWLFGRMDAYYHANAATSLGIDRIAEMSWRDWWTISVPCGLVTSGDIGLSNLSLVTISITFYTMVKSSAPIFVLIWAYIFGIERITCTLILVVAIIAAGEFLTVAGEVNFELVGFLLCLSASMLSGMRWTLVQLKLQTLDPPLKTTLATMRLLSPSMFWSMVVLSMIVERPWNKFDGWTGDQMLYIMGLGFSGALIAIAMILCEFHLIMHSSAVILMLGGVIKELITIIVGVFYFDDQLNRINIAGCFVVFLGVIFYKVTHYMEKKAKEDALRKRSASESDLFATYTKVASLESDNEVTLNGRTEDETDVLRRNRGEVAALTSLELRGSSREHSGERPRMSPRVSPTTSGQQNGQQVALELEPII
ncbi:hypothetical protein MPSEU_000201700 [Mayamaea pseudoterrestris]|nr:hypothetical protein MPSEU_000201700 [Mayamaea pseudoterrestris]